MKLLRLAAFGLLLGAVTNCTAYSQPPGYGAPPQYGNDSRYGGDPRYGDPRGYDGWSSPREDVGFFYEELSPYGDWVLTRDYGWAWFPRNVSPSWRPYREGRWVDSEYGWTWVSYEPYGWATYHYGRWAPDPRFGWLWIPGTTWGPAWVSWQHGNGYLGWAPLPPSVGFEVGVGIRFGGISLSFGIQPDSYSFVPERSFLEPRLSGYVIPTARNVTIIHNTTNITNYTYVDNRVINRGVDRQRIERLTGRRVQEFRINESNDRTRSQVARDEVRIYRPKKQELESVRVGSRTGSEHRRDGGSPADNRNRPATEGRGDIDFRVAPRSERAPQVDLRKIDQRDQHERRQLEQYQAAEKRKVEKLQQQETVKGRAQADRNQVDKRHQAELAALQQEHRTAAQQLAARQKAQREAALESSSSSRGRKPPAQGKNNDEGRDKKDKGKKDQDEKSGKRPPA